jgi:hypothetical protein
VSGHGRFGTNGNGKVGFRLSNELVTFAHVRGLRGRFTGDVVSVTGAPGEATLAATGSWNGQGGYTFAISVVDVSRRGRNSDTISVVIHDPAGALVFTSFGPQILKQGDIAVTVAASG